MKQAACIHPAAATEFTRNYPDIVQIYRTYKTGFPDNGHLFILFCSIPAGQHPAAKEGQLMARLVQSREPPKLGLAAWQPLRFVRIPAGLPGAFSEVA